VYGTRKPTLWWIFTSRRWIELPINAYVIEHDDGLVLFDTGMDRAVVTDPDYWPDPITALFMRRIFRWNIGPDDTLAQQLELAGYSPADVRKAVISHLHADHVGGIGDIPDADLYVSSEAWEHMLGPHPEREMVLRRDIDIPGARWHQFTFEATDDPSLAPFGASFDLMGDGSMMILPTPGHLAGSVSMLVRRGNAAPLLLIGDLTYAEELLDQDRIPGTGHAAQLRESYAKVRGLRDRTPGLVILPAHDPKAADKLLV
jgi:glyoxylase-like metal-dependent hydrolase (beta-lactamase superfamily II)